MSLNPFQTEAKRKALDETWRHIHEEHYRLLNRIETSVLYHQKRERFFEICDKWGKAISIIGGSAVLARNVTAGWIQLAAILIAVTSTLSLVFGLADRSRRHAELARSFKQLEAEVLSKGKRDFDESDLSNWEGKLRLLEVGEPPALATLVILSQNEIARAQGRVNNVIPVPWWKRLLAHFFDLGETHGGLPLLLIIVIAIYIGYASLR